MYFENVSILDRMLSGLRDSSRTQICKHIEQNILTRVTRKIHS